MRYLKATAWSMKYFMAGSRPRGATLRRWLQNGTVPCRKIGGSWYVDEQAWLADGDDLAARVLQGE